MIIVRHYNHSLQSHPFTTKALSGGLICSMGDCIRQKFEISAKVQTDFSWRRMGIAWTMGCFFMTPFFHVNYKYILPTLLKSLPFDTSTKWRAAVGKMLIDQTLCTSYLACHYLMFINILETGSVTKGIEAIKNKFTQLMTANWRVWPIAQMINFLFVPPQYQVLWTNFIGLFWNTYLSYLQHI